MFWFWIGLAIFGGFCLGILVMCLMAAASESERKMQKDIAV